jgi:hypothetical protein
VPERHVTEILDEVFRRAGMKRGLKRAEAVLLWPRVVGAEVARFANARALRDGVLYVDVSDAETAMHLGLQRRRFLAVYHDTYQAHEVKDIRFQVGTAARADERGGGPSRRGDAKTGAGTGPAASPDAAELAELARQIGAMGLPDDVATAALRAGRSLLTLRARQRAEGWQPCPTCGALHDGAVRPDTPRERTLRSSGRLGVEERRDRELCPACRRASHEPRVREAAQRLATRPSVVTPDLSEEERAVALRLAAEYLDGVLRELLPVALGDPSAREHLERAARCRAALEHGKEPDDVDDDDLARLPAAVRRLLRGDW